MARKVDPAKREAILEAGRKVFLRDGYAAAKMSDIAGEAGVAPGTLYLYFDSKEELAAAIGEDFFQKLSKGFSKVFEKLDKPGGIANLVDFALKIGTEERDLLALVKLQLPHPERERDCQDGGPRLQFLHSLAQALERLQSRENSRQYDAFALANVIMSIIQGMTMACVFTDYGTDEIKQTAIKVLQHALFEDGAMLPSTSTRVLSRAKANASAAAKDKVKEKAKVSAKKNLK
jgi:AcrR family transcriptional regulator